MNADDIFIIVVIAVFVLFLIWCAVASHNDNKKTDSLYAKMYETNRKWADAYARYYFKDT